MVANWRAGFRFDAGWRPDDHRRAQAVWPRLLKLTRMMYEGGVPMTIGTDQANPFIAPGISVAREMALHRQAGIPAWAVLRMATSDAARILGLGERTGALRPGLEADILFIAADPRPDLNRVADVRAVVNNGVLLTPERLRAGNAKEEDHVKSKKLLIGACLVGLVVLAWTGALLAFLLLDPTLAQWTLIVTAAAIVSEVAMWIGVALLGLTALDRFRIWARLRGTR